MSNSPDKNPKSFEIFDQSNPHMVEPHLEPTSSNINPPVEEQPSETIFKTPISSTSQPNEPKSLNEEELSPTLVYHPTLELNTPQIPISYP